jgi:predicted small lipoprotein YifL
MNKVVLIAVVAAALMSVAACGKGKAPPPVAAPIVTKG